MAKNSYYAQFEGWILSEYRQLNGIVEAGDDEAKYLLLTGAIGTSPATGPIPPIPPTTPTPQVLVPSDALAILRGGNPLTATLEQLLDLLRTTIAALVDNGSASTDKTWSSQKVVDALATLKSDIVGAGASAALDTLKEIGDALAGNDTAITAITSGLSRRVRVDVAQSLTSGEQAQARDNIGAAPTASVGDPATNFVSLFEQALV